MATHNDGTHNAREIVASASGESSQPTQQARSYQAPELHRVGDLGKLQHYGFYYHDGYRYKNDY